MARGRKPKPPALQLLRGNPGNRPLPSDAPDPARGIPDCPPHVAGEAKRAWDYLGAILDEMGVLTTSDGPALAMLAIIWARWVEMEAAIAKHGVVVKGKNPKTPGFSTYLSVANQLLKQLHTLFAEFGMTPAARSRVLKEKGAGPADKFDTFLKKKRG